MNLKEQLDALLDATAFDSTGTKVGAVRQVYVDDASGKITFATVSTGIFSADAIVPLHGARLLDRELHVDHTRSVIRDSPRPDDTEDGLSPEQEIKLLEYYGIEAPARRGDAAAPAPSSAPTPAQGPAAGPASPQKSPTPAPTPAPARKSPTSKAEPTTEAKSDVKAEAKSDTKGEKKDETTGAPTNGANAGSPKDGANATAPKDRGSATVPKDRGSAAAPKGEDEKESTTTTSSSTPAKPADSPARPSAGTPGGTGTSTPTTSKNGGRTSSPSSD